MTTKLYLPLPSLPSLHSHTRFLFLSLKQKIYEWRGASIRNWRLFQDKFGRAEITHVNLLQNYRSSANIVSAAQVFTFFLPSSFFLLLVFCFVCDRTKLKFHYQGLIEKNEARMEKRLIATLPVGDKVLHIFLSCPHLSTPLKKIILYSNILFEGVKSGLWQSEGRGLSNIFHDQISPRIWACI